MSKILMAATAAVLAFSLVTPSQADQCEYALGIMKERLERSNRAYPLDAYTH